MALLMNEMGEFVDSFDPNPDEKRLKAYAGIRRLDPAKMTVKDRNRDRKDGRCRR